MYIQFLEIAVLQTKNERLRWLCSEENEDEQSRNSYRDLVISLVDNSPNIAVDNKQSQSDWKGTQILIDKMKLCRHRYTTTDCGCAGAARCKLGKGRNGIVNYNECFECIKNGSGYEPLPTTD